MNIDRRGVVASVLAFIYPGLGHAYLREWVRALAWFALALVTAAILMPASAYDAVQQGGVTALMSYQFPLSVTLGILAVRVLTTVDAYRVAVRQSMPSAADSAQPECPVCGRALDPDLDFCPWCTTELEWIEPAEQYQAE